MSLGSVLLGEITLREVGRSSVVQKLTGPDSWRWDKLSRRYRRHHPLCTFCKREGRISLATVVDHIVPHRGNRELLFDMNNLQGLCTPCHNSTKQIEDIRGYNKQIGEDGWPVDPRHPANKKEKK